MANQNYSSQEPFAPRNALSPTEMEILELLARGWTAREAAGRVNLGVRTVEFNLNARNPAHLISCAFSKGALKAMRGVVVAPI